MKFIWNEASDNLTSASGINYYLFKSTVGSGDCLNIMNSKNSASAFAHTMGASAISASGFTYGVNYYFGVRAVDKDNNWDNNISIVMSTPVDLVAPDFPFGLTTATSGTPSSGTVYLTWTPLATDEFIYNNSDMRYVVYSSVSSGFSSQFGANYKTSGSATVASYLTHNASSTALTVSGFSTAPGSALVSNLSSGYEYAFLVQAKDLAGNISNNNVVKYWTTQDKVAPIFNGIFSASATSETTALLSWLPASDNVTASGFISYVYFLSPSSGVVFSSPTASATVPSSSTTLSSGYLTYSVSGLNTNSNYYFGVRAIDLSGNLDNNNAIYHITTQDLTPPVFAGLSNVVLGSPSSGSVNLIWNSLATDSGTSNPINMRYVMYSLPTSGQSLTASYIIQHASGTATTASGFSSAPASATVSGLLSGVEYAFVVRAEDSAGNFDINTQVRNISTTDSISPVMNGTLSFTQVRGTYLTLSWSPATDNLTPASGISYEVMWASGGQFTNGTSFSSHASAGAGVTSLLITGLTATTTYWFWVRAKDSSGNYSTSVYSSGMAGAAGVTTNFNILQNVTSLASNLSNPSTYAVKSDGSVVKWGMTATSVVYTSTPYTLIPASGNTIKVAATLYASFALDSLGNIRTWNSGQIFHDPRDVVNTNNGDISPYFSSSGANKITDVACGIDSFFYRLINGNVTSFGINGGYNGSLANNMSTSGNVTAIYSHNNQVSPQAILALRNSGELWYIDAASNTSGSMNPSLPTGITKVSKGVDHTLVIDSSGSVWGFGGNSYNQINSTGTTSLTAVKISGLPTNIIDVCAGFYKSFARDNLGNIYTWGYNVEQGMGYNSGGVVTTPTINTHIPLAIAGETNASDQFWLNSDGTVLSAGSSSYGIGRLGSATGLDYVIEEIPTVIL